MKYFWHGCKQHAQTRGGEQGLIQHGEGTCNRKTYNTAVPLPREHKEQCSQEQRGTTSVVVTMYRSKSLPPPPPPLKTITLSFQDHHLKLSCSGRVMRDVDVHTTAVRSFAVCPPTHCTTTLAGAEEQQDAAVRHLRRGVSHQVPQAHVGKCCLCFAFAFALLLLCAAFVPMSMSCFGSVLYRTISYLGVGFCVPWFCFGVLT